MLWLLLLGMSLLIIVIWSKGMYDIRARITRSSACRVFYCLMQEVCCSRKIAAGFQGTSGGLAKVGTGSVMLVGIRKIVYRYKGICISCSVDHHGLYLFV
ncbi:MAG: hypothetical protein GX660_16075 [Clostridiaceae bacterium]|nr:hypothetical protein [Clostridiaceae bacterium]